MPLISIRLVAGRSTDEIRALVSGVSEAAAEALDMPVDRVGVHVLEIDPERVARGGRLLADVRVESEER